jgi:hypothetical protein
VSRLILIEKRNYRFAPHPGREPIDSDWSADVCCFRTEVGHRLRRPTPYRRGCQKRRLGGNLDNNLIARCTKQYALIEQLRRQARKIRRDRGEVRPIQFL